MTTKVNLRVLCGDKTQTLGSSVEENILDCLENHGITVQFHCRDGFCGACRCKLISGSVSYTTDPLAFIDDNEFLPCCSRANGDITIEIDH